MNYLISKTLFNLDQEIPASVESALGIISNQIWIGEKFFME